MPFWCTMKLSALSSLLLNLLSHFVTLQAHELGDDLRCGFHLSIEEQQQLSEEVKAWKKKHELDLRGLQGDAYQIPVQMTVLQSEDGRGIITQEGIDGLMETLNYGFRDSPFSFTLLGVERATNDTWFKCDDEEAYKSIYKVGGRETLNVYLCNTFAVAYGIYGISTGVNPTYEVVDGIILMNPSLAKLELSQLLMENLLVHEVGHWLGLLHTFENGCEGDGDGITDTPAHDRASSQVPGTSECWQLDPPVDTCPDDQYPDADPGFDPVDNYMNYLYYKDGDWGYCYDLYARFTDEQIARMSILYGVYRRPAQQVGPTSRPTSAPPTLAPIALLPTLPPTVPIVLTAPPTTSPTTAPATLLPSANTAIVASPTPSPVAVSLNPSPVPFEPSADIVETDPPSDSGPSSNSVATSGTRSDGFTAIASWLVFLSTRLLY